jgi:beta-lactamase superfamily II metal-dependent hydrolase
LTGDINLNNKYQELKKHYQNYLDSILLTQIPHHGARKNWKRDILSDLRFCFFWVLSCGFTNRYGHPHLSVVMNILNNEYFFGWCNEFNGITMEGEIKW